MVVAAAPDLRRQFRSMAADIEFRVIAPEPGADLALEAASAVVDSVAVNLTRFDPDSALSQVNRDPTVWHQVPTVLGAAIAEAERAHLETYGLFDPRVVDTLLSWGYDRTFDDLRAEHWDVSQAPQSAAAGTQTSWWRPTVLNHDLIHLGGQPIDLGGIGKGLAVRAAAAQLQGAGAAVLVDAGGDLWLGGAGPDGEGWKVGVEDPTDRSQNLVVLALSDTACATSSIVRRRWRVGNQLVHHLIDPRTRTPGGAGLAAVTVVDPDPARAEVWSKALFLTGVHDIAAHALVHELAACWVGIDGAIGMSEPIRDSVRWQVQR